MITSFDGNVFSGKTSLIKALLSVGDFQVIAEHSEFLSDEHFVPRGTSVERAIILQSRYISAELKRTRSISSSKSILLDRSFVSMAAHVAAIYSTSAIDIRRWFLQEMCDLMLSGKILIPNNYCFVRCSHRTINRRRQSVRRITDPTYYSEQYLKAVDKFNDSWIKRMGGFSIDTDGLSPVGLVQVLKQQKQLHRQELCRALDAYATMCDILMRL